ncbi:MAG: elongation factor P [Candidatus Parcubacteria bacterium]|nr:elongation factor P [Candidatus Parcubacteria bacterium]
MLEYSEITPKKCIIMDGAPYEVLSSHVFRMQMRKPVNQTKLKNIITGKVTERSFHQSEKAEEADIETKNIKYLYENRGEYWFCEEKDPSKRFKLNSEIYGNGAKYVKPNTLVEAMVFEDEIIGIKLPIKVELKVTEAAPAVKGDTAQGASKTVTMETGLTLNVPLFINEGDVLRINTDTGEYAERVDKK